MTKILCIETATEICSVAISLNNNLINYREACDQNSHSEKITIFVEEILAESSIKLTEIDAIAISMGPGSYTGLRIGTSTAKGFCFALNIPLIAVSTLQAIAFGAKKYNTTTNGLIIPMIDARRMEIYTATYASDLAVVEDVKSVVVDDEYIQTLPSDIPLIFCGNGVPKCTSLLEQKSNAILTNIGSSARYMAELAFEKYNKEQFEDVAYFEPFYLKDFIAAKSYVKGLR
jgi:tRNA threonylcarbamoyladenosine biosynthesis protein TsaB